MKYISLFLGLFFFSINSFTQNKTQSNTDLGPQGEIHGIVIDKKDKAPIDYANVIVYKSKDSSMVTGALTNSKGKFLIEKLIPGKYFVKVNFIGFGIKSITNLIIIPPDKLSLNLGTIELETTATNLGVVNISGEKDQIEYNLDKKVINVDKNILATGGTALDVMQTIPSINVDIDGTVSLRGSSNVTIFIDGRPSGLTSLDQMPAAQIDKVEIVTNPSARYDPDGMSGIINIVTKRKKEPGYNGMVSGNVSSNGQYSGSVNLGYNRKKFNLYANVDLRRNRFKSTSDTYRELFVNDTTTFFDQYNNSLRKGFYGNFKAGTDIFINPKNTLSFYGVYNFRRGKPSDTTSYKNFDFNDVLSDFYKKGSTGKSINDGFEINIDYKKTFKNKGQELTANLFYSNSGWDSYSDLNTLWFSPDQIPIDSTLHNQNTVNTNKSISYNGQVDYVHPLGKWGRIETGYKGSYRINENNYTLNYLSDEIWQKDTLSSNDFEYDEQMHSAYFIYAGNIKKFKFQLGLRAEQVLTVSDQITSQKTYKHNYLNIFPTVHLKYEFTEHNALQISYSRRVHRPRSNSLNPFVDYTDPMNISSGNPYLEPEFTNSFELGHLIDFKSTSINTTLFYRETENMITRVVDVDSLGVSRSTYSNLDKGSSFGVELIVSQGIFKWWKLNGNFSYFGVKFYGSSNTIDFNDVNTSWTVKINSAMTFWKSMDLQLSFNYRSPVFTAQNSGGYFGGSGGGSQGKQKENYFFDIGLKKDFLKNKLTLSLRLSDIFNTNNYQLETKGVNYTSLVNRKRESRVLFFGVSYKINGGFKQKKRKVTDDNSNDTEEQ
jgi:outer membrane receptor protein involved in Fe transport